MKSQQDMLVFRLAMPSPIMTLLCGILIFVLIYLFSPITTDYSFRWEGVGYVVLSCLLLIVGLAIGARFVFKRVQLLAVSRRKTLKIWRCSLVVAGVGALLRIYDRAIVRGASLSGDFFAARESLAEAGVGLASIASAVTVPFCYVVIFMSFIVWRTGMRNFSRLLWLIPIALFPALDAVWIGSRSSVLVLASFILVCLLVFEVFRTHKWVLPAFVMFMVAAIWGSGLLFISRTEQMGLDPIVSAYMSGYAEFATISDGAVAILERGDLSGMDSLLFGVINFSQYYTHGFFEFLYLYENHKSWHSMGAYSFNVYLKFVSYMIPLGDYSSVVEDAQVRQGVFNTILGPVFIDFGVLGYFFVLFLGGLIGLVSRKAMKGSVSVYPMLIYFLICLFFAPVVSLLVFAQGLYTITSFIFFAFLCKVLGYRAEVFR
ncbi:hypothetical protein KFE80_03750 [bacterium SCSIO 12696]|nr:hypothetical protein KFE80_03750 [bacterium SCSIO 12696]